MFVVAERPEGMQSRGFLEKLRERSRTYSHDLRTCGQQAGRRKEARVRRTLRFEMGSGHESATADLGVQLVWHATAEASNITRWQCKFVLAPTVPASRY